MALMMGRVMAVIRRAACLSWCRRQQRYLVLLACLSLLACLHFLGGSGGLFSAGLTGLETADDVGVDTVSARHDAIRLDELGGVALWPPPPSPRQVAQALGSANKPSTLPQHTSQRQEDAKGLVSSPGIPASLQQPSLQGDIEIPHVRSFPWPVRQNFIPNYFLNYNSSSSSADPAFLDPSKVLVYLHHNKAAGTTTKRCLSTLASADLGRSTGPVLSSEGRLAVEARFARNKQFMLRSKPNTYFGGYAFGLCDRYDRPCAYFTVMRDPYERTLSSHSYCKHARQDQLCSALVAGRVSLREWAIHQGSFFFRQLLFQPEFCRDKSHWMQRIKIDAAPHDFVKKFREPWKGAPCWFREKLIMEQTLNQTEYEALLRYCLDNLERWFTVIMLVDRYDESLHMAQEAFKLPMYGLCAGRHDNSGSYNKTVNPIPNPQNIPQNSTRSVRQKLDSDGSEQALLLQLRNDPEVRRVLHADELLYQKGLEIFNKQLEIFNQIRSRT